ncbi:hypothetical protein ACEWY4_010728 [Coilia grayii]|uniref:Cadherin domain-containing protein n=1 Tax=Coilia grayii TaxID=363190 RepID=A0ABD1K2Q3_9TELE
MAIKSRVRQPRLKSPGPPCALKYSLQPRAPPSLWALATLCYTWPYLSTGEWLSGPYLSVPIYKLVVLRGEPVHRLQEEEVDMDRRNCLFTREAMESLTEESRGEQLGDINIIDRYARQLGDINIVDRYARQLGDIEFSNRYAEYMRSKAKISTICTLLRRMQNAKKSGFGGDAERVNTLLKQYMCPRDAAVVSTAPQIGVSPADMKCSGLRSPGVMPPSGLRSPAVLSVALLLALVGQGQAQQICSSSTTAPEVPEDTALGTVIASITADEGVVLSITKNFDGTFDIQGLNLILTKALDYENVTSYVVQIQCSKGDEILNIQVPVIVTNVNDEKPEFALPVYELAVDELVPVGTSVGDVIATDKDGNLLFYKLDPPQEYFYLQTVNLPTIRVQKRFDYDTVPRVDFKLVVQDTETSTPPSFTATTSVIITIRDIDNRPPWFQPCTETNIGQSTVCLSAGYQGKVNLTQQTVGVLTLQPNALYAVDGDKSINAAISYRIMSGNDDNIFDIGESTGNITMQKPADVKGPIVLNVMAFQTVNSDQFSTTTVTFEVLNMTRHPPKFEQDTYEGHISLDAGVGSLVLEGKDSTKPLQVQATDQDFANGFNPDVKYEVQGNSNFSITQQGFIIMVNKVPAGPVSIQVRAVDTTTDEEAVASVEVEVTPETTTTTAMPSTTTDMPSTTTDMPSTTTDTPSTTTDMSTATTDVVSSSTVMTSSLTSAMSSQPTTPQTTTDRGDVAAGVYRVEDMAAVGATLGALLLISAVLIIVMALQIRGHSTHLKKIQEISHFHSNLAGVSPGLKDGVQYSNDGFQGDGDDGSTGGSKLSDESDLQMDELDQRPATTRAAEPHYETAKADAASLAESSRSDKEVKPILTKERRDDEGYKAVWFKEDIDPDAKDEVTIIPDRAEHDDDDGADDDDDDVDDDREEDDVSVDGESDFNQVTTDIDQNSDDDDFPQTSDL